MYRLLLGNQFAEFDDFDDLFKAADVHKEKQYLRKSDSISEYVLNITDLARYIREDNDTPLIVLCTEDYQNHTYYCANYATFMNNLDTYYRDSLNNAENIEVYRVSNLQTIYGALASQRRD